VVSTKTAVPNDLEAEESLLGAMLLSQAATERAVELVQAADFYKPAHGHIFAAMDSLYRSGRKIDAVTVVDELRSFGLLDSIGDPSIFVSLQANTPSIANAIEYAQIVVRHSTGRRMMQLAGEATNRLAEYADPYEMAEQLKDGIANIDFPVTMDHQEAMTLDDVIADADEMAPWVIPGIIRIDWRIVIVAGEGSGKSTLLRQIAACAAQGIHPFRVNSDIPPVRVLIVDLENPAAAIAETGATLVNLCRRRRGDAYVADRLKVFRRQGGLDIRSRHDRTELEREISLHQPALLVIGPGYKLIHRRDGRGGRESHEEATEPVFEILDDLRTRHGFALMIEHHAPKGDPRNRALTPYGSQRWMAIPEMGITMAQDNEPWRYTLARFRGDRLKSDWPVELHRSDRMHHTGEPWPWVGRWDSAQVTEPVESQEPMFEDEPF
jgi:replicative DNA helicase